MEGGEKLRLGNFFFRFILILIFLTFGVRGGQSSFRSFIVVVRGTFTFVLFFVEERRLRSREEECAGVVVFVVVSSGVVVFIVVIGVFFGDGSFVEDVVLIDGWRFQEFEGFVNLAVFVTRTG